MKPLLKTIRSVSVRTESQLPALSARRLSAVFHNEGRPNIVLADISFDIFPGQLICLIGPSGCGKTTLLSMIAGFLKPTGGEIHVNGRPVSRPGPDRCVVFQQDALFPWLTVEENIAFGLKRRSRNRKESRQAVTRILDLVGLLPFRNYLPDAISGGMKQRVALARVLVLRPEILLMDEPFGALDAQSREDMQDLLLELWGKLKPTIFFVTHDLSEAIVLADRIMLMDKAPGRIVSDIAVNLPRPRKRESDQFHLLYKTIRQRF